MREEFCKMRMDGYALSEIAKEYNTTRQNVHQTLRHCRDGRTPCPFETSICKSVPINWKRYTNIKYPNLQDCLNKRRITRTVLCKEMGYSSKSLFNDNFFRKLNSDTLSLKEVKRLTEYLGVPFEELFNERNTK